MTEYVRLGDVFELQMGKTPSRDILEYWNNGDNSWVSISDMSNYSKYVGKTKETISNLGVEKSGIKIVPPNTVIMSFKLSIGKTAITTDSIYTNEAIMAFIPKDKLLCHTDYLYYMLSGINWDKGVNKAVKGNTLNKKTISDYYVPLPPLEDQKRIAAALDTMSSVISRRKRQIELLDEAAKSLFVEMFGDPVENPMGWDVVALSECLESIDNGKSFVCDSEKRKGISPAVLKLSAATYGYYQPEENKAIISESQFIEKAEVHAGDLLFTRKNTPELVGMCAYVFSTPEKLMMPDLIFRLNTNDCCNKLYLWRLINHSLFRERVRNLASGSAKSMSNISKKSLNNLEIPLPPIDLQNLFAARIEALEAERASCERGLSEMEMAFSAMMQEYFG